ncbi:hypothetical protein B0H19DRAFT_90505 [Mycena capillaripes]|nr:hypothetical protein B0H19DRAFT_90505 [Mycena capillaripes]
MASPTAAANPNALRVRRKPAPKLDAEDDAALKALAVEDDVPARLPQRASFALYPDLLPLSPVDAADGEDDVPARLPQRASFALYPDFVPDSLPAPLASPAPSVSSSTSTPHYTRRRAHTSLSPPSSPSPTPTATPMTTTTTSTTADTKPRKSGLARLHLLLPHAHPHSHTGVPIPIRKHTISTPTPAPFPPGMIPPALAALAAARDGREIKLRDLELPLSPTRSFASSSSSSGSGSSSSSRTSGESESAGTSPPVSPFSVAALSPISPVSPSCATVPPASESPIADVALKRRGSARIVKRRPSVNAATYASTAPPPLSISATTPSPTSPRKNNARKATKPPPLAPLAPPTRAALLRAARLPLVAPSGVRVPFGEVLGVPRGALGVNAFTAEVDVDAPAGSPTRTRRTLVIFLRHFWCPLCQDYMAALARAVSAAAATTSVSARSISTTHDDNTTSTPTSSTSKDKHDANNTHSAHSTPADSMPMPTTTTTTTINPIPPSLSALFAPLDAPTPEDSDAPKAEGENPDTEGNEVEAPCPACASIQSQSHADGTYDAYLESLISPSSSRDSEPEPNAGGEASEGEEAKAEGEDAKAEGEDAKGQEAGGEREEEEETQTQTQTHILLIAPGAHTLAERYLGSFGFPSSLSSNSAAANSSYDYDEKRFDLGDPFVPPSAPTSATPTPTSPHPTPANAERDTRANENKNKNPNPRRKNPIASIRLFVDPRPAEGVYAALGMGWAPSRGASPVASPVVSTFAEAGCKFMDADGGGTEMGCGSPTVPIAMPGFAGAGAGAGAGTFGRRGGDVDADVGGEHAPEHTDEHSGREGGEGGEEGEGSPSPLSAAFPASLGLALAASTSPTTSPSTPTTVARDQDTPASPTSSPSNNSTPDPHAAPATYITHGALSGVGAVLLRALRAGMPVWERGGM